MKKFLSLLFFISIISFSQAANPPIYIAFQWHMHQPVYWPGETVMQTITNNRMSYSLLNVFTDRTGPYTTYAPSAVNKLLGFNNAGAQVSFSGSLIENLNVLESNSMAFSGWKSNWTNMTSKKTALGNQRLDMVGFGYHHPIMPLIDSTDMRKHIQKHKAVFAANFPGLPYSKGIFPPENAFEIHNIPALVDEGFEWVMVDNSHFDRSCVNYPWVNGFSIVEQNNADQINTNPGDWVSLTDMYAPGKISGGWGHRPHWMRYIDPASGKEYKMIAVPTSMLFGNEDGRGGFGALLYDKCMSQLESYNTDPAHPILIVLHHDGDNHGGGSSGYYGSNFDNFVSWLQANPSRFVCTTVQDYLDKFPPAPSDFIHVEAGSWYGAGADPTFSKWNGDPGKYALNGNTLSNYYSPDRNSWSVITAASNIVKTAEQINASSADTKLAWEHLMVGQTSCYWYWDGTEDWDTHPTRASNMATAKAMPVVNSGNDLTPPSIYHPQRKPYNPGATEWLIVQPADFTVWTYVYDISGLTSVKLKYRTVTAANNKDLIVNKTYTGGAGVGEWQTVEMKDSTIASYTTMTPVYKANQYSAKITGLKNKLVDYYVESTDTKGNVARSIILHTWVGSGSANSNPVLTVSPSGGRYVGGTTVTLTATAENPPVNIYYTLDGTTPTTSSTKVSSGATVPITTDATVLKAYAVDLLGLSSALATHTYYTTVASGGITVRFQKPDAWTSVGFYAWTGTSTALLGAWPGTTIAAGLDGWYSYTFDSSETSVNMVFNNGAGNSQSVDVTGITASACYKTNGLSGEKYLIVTTTCPTTSVSSPVDYSLKIYPNPVIDKLNLSSDEVITKVELINIFGSVIKTFYNETILSLSEIPGGIYLLKINYNNNKQTVSRINKL
ncbi:MAG: starch-binding protein [Paludibacter sp.]|nr:starch-binding protein [Paludibacter sp.]